MLFSSVPFVFYFLPALIGIYALAPGRAAKNAALLAASLFFYAWGETFYIVLLLGSIALNHLIGAQIARREGRGRGLALGAGVAVNLALLGVFKYLGFITAQLAWAGAPEITPHLPLGVSFFTFQAISYLVDVARRDAPPARALSKTALYIALFPQLIAGPIVRFKEIADQLDAREESWEGFAAGAQLFIMGLGQKVLLANTLAGPADAAFGQDPGVLTVGLAWLGAVSYALQIYYDFAGYSNMALGLGLMFGLTLPRNFEHPYWSTSFREFWRRWHITLSSWFRDYLYIPLGGSRAGALATYRNLVIVFVLCGLWHGAAWTFVLWGLWHGAFLVFERAAGAVTTLRPPRFVAMAYVFVFVTLGWVLFRADSLGHAGAYWGAMAGFAQGEGARDGAAFYLSDDVKLALVAGIALAAPFPARWAERFGEGRAWRVGASWTAAFGVMLACWSAIAAGAYDPFIYFRF